MEENIVNNETNKNKKKLVIILVILAVVVFGAVTVLAVWLKKGEQEIIAPAANQPPAVVDKKDDAEAEAKTLVNGRIFLEPDSEKIAVGKILTVAIYLNTGGADISAASVELVFDSDKLELAKKADYQGTVMSIGMPEAKKTDRIMITRGQPGDGDWQDKDDGFNGEKGLLGKVSFKVKAIGKTTINLVAENSKLVLDDARGTAIKNMSYGAGEYEIQ